MNPNQQLHEAGQSIWIDSITREMVTSGTLRRYIDDLAVSGLTSNPSIFEKALASADYDEQIEELLAAGKRGEELFFELAITDLRAAADLFAEVHSRSGGRDGFVSLEVSPELAYDTAATTTAAASLATAADRENLFIKIPGTREGGTAIEETIAAGIPVNVTLLFDHHHYREQADAYMRGIERRIENGLDPAVPSVASIFVSRWDVAVTETVPAELADGLGIAAATKTWAVHNEVLASERWQKLERAGARAQRLLFASTSTKDPSWDDTHYVKGLAAAGTINTLPEETVLAFADHGEVGGLLPADGGDVEARLAAYEEAGVDLGSLAARLQSEGAEKFVASWNDLLEGIAAKSADLAAAS